MQTPVERRYSGRKSLSATELNLSAENPATRPVPFVSDARFTPDECLLFRDCYWLFWDISETERFVDMDALYGGGDAQCGWRSVLVQRVQRTLVSPLPVRDASVFPTLEDYRRLVWWLRPVLFHDAPTADAERRVSSWAGGRSV